MLKRDFKSTINLSHLEGGLYALMVASIENFLLYYSVSIGVSAGQLGLVSTLPLFIGAIGQFTMPGLVGEKHVGRFVIITMLVQVFGVVGILLHSFYHFTFSWLLMSAILYYLGGMSSTPFWMDWAQGLIPKRNFTKYVAKRNGYTLKLIVFFFISFAVLNKFFHFPLQAIFCVGVFARILSACLQIYIQKGDYVQKKKPKGIHQKESFLSLKEIEHLGPNLKKSLLVFLIATAMFKFGVQITSPFLAEYMVKDLKLDILFYVVLVSVPVFSRALFFKNWARIAGGTRIYSSLFFCVIYLSFIPLIWTFSKSFFYLCIIEMITGLFWSGFDLMSVLFIQNSIRKNARKYLGFNMALGSLLGLLGATVGAYLWESGASFKEIMYIGTFARFSIWLFWGALIIYFSTYGKFNIQRLISGFWQFAQNKRVNSRS